MNYWKNMVVDGRYYNIIRNYIKNYYKKYIMGNKQSLYKNINIPITFAPHGSQLIVLRKTNPLPHYTQISTGSQHARISRCC